MMFGLFDIAASIVFGFAHTGIPGWLSTFIVVFLAFKGTTTMINFPIWFGPVSFFAGLIDLVAGLTLYFSSSYTGAFVTISAVIAVYLTIKGGFTLLFGLVSR